MDSRYAILKALTGTGIDRYVIRVSGRARHAQLRLTQDQGLEVVLPEGFHPGRVPELIRSRHRWLERHHRRLRAEMDRAGAELRSMTPERIDLHALGETRGVIYDDRSECSPVIREVAGGLIVDGAGASREEIPRVLQTWLMARARDHLRPLVAELAAETGLEYAHVSIRRQKTRWGSCSRGARISLNCKLLFLEPDEVRYVLVHELCHTRHMDHSPRFWDLVQHCLPEYRTLDRGLRNAWLRVPRWADA